MSYRLTVCIVAYKNYNDIKKAVASMEQYTSPDLKKQVYIVDNGAAVSSPTDVDDFVSYVSAINDCVYVDAKRNLGFGKGNNCVLDRLDSDYHAIVNPDIIFCEDTFSKMINWMDTNPEVGMAIPEIIDSKGKRQEVYRRELTVLDLFNRMFLGEALHKRAFMHNMRDMNYNNPFQVPFGQGSFLVIRTDLFKELHGFDDNYFMYVEDADLCKRVNQVSKLMYFPYSKVIHKWQKQSHKNLRLFKYHIKSVFYYFKKWGIHLW